MKESQTMVPFLFALLHVTTSLCIDAFHIPNDFSGKRVTATTATTSNTATITTTTTTTTTATTLHPYQEEAVHEVRLRRQRHYSNLPTNYYGFDEEYEKEEAIYTLFITHENQTSKIFINESESILNALERNKAQNLQQHINSRIDSQSTSTSTSTNSVGHTTTTTEGGMMINKSGNSLLASIPSLPQDCRKGNCLTCSAVHLPQSNKNSVVTINDGLSPHVRSKIDEKGYVQTCSSYVTGDGVWLELGVCNDVWDSVYMSPHSDVESERIRNEAMAKCMRIADEKNVMKWVQKTERMMLNENESNDSKEE